MILAGMTQPTLALKGDNIAWLILTGCFFFLWCCCQMNLLNDKLKRSMCWSRHTTARKGCYHTRTSQASVQVYFIFKVLTWEINHLKFKYSEQQSIPNPSLLIAAHSWSVAFKKAPRLFQSMKDEFRPTKVEIYHYRVVEAKAGTD